MAIILKQQTQQPHMTAVQHQCCRHPAMWLSMMSSMVITVAHCHDYSPCGFSAMFLRAASSDPLQFTRGCVSRQSCTHLAALEGVEWRQGCLRFCKGLLVLHLVDLQVQALWTQAHAEQNVSSY